MGDRREWQKAMEQYKHLFVKYLNQLQDEIGSYRDEANIWKLAGEIPNTPGNLCLHLCGNLRHNIGATIGKTGYVRNRDEEFSKKNVPREELLKEVEKTSEMIIPVIESLTEDGLKRFIPADKYSQGGTVAEVLLRTGMHLGYHLGQINYHRRMVEKSEG
jgi:hypothetical protein